MWSSWFIAELNFYTFLYMWVNVFMFLSNTICSVRQLLIQQNWKRNHIKLPIQLNYMRQHIGLYAKITMADNLGTKIPSCHKDPPRRFSRLRVCSPPLSKSWLHPWFTVWMFFVAHFSILFSSNANNFFLNNFFRIIFIMPAVCPRSLRRNLATSTTNHSARFYRK